jgi:hypothetical protein
MIRWFLGLFARRAPWAPTPAPVPPRPVPAPRPAPTPAGSPTTPPPHAPVAVIGIFCDDRFVCWECIDGHFAHEHDGTDEVKLVTSRSLWFGLAQCTACGELTARAERWC